VGVLAPLAAHLDRVTGEEPRHASVDVVGLLPPVPRLARREAEHRIRIAADADLAEAAGERIEVGARDADLRAGREAVALRGRLVAVIVQTTAHVEDGLRAVNAG